MRIGGVDFSMVITPLARSESTMWQSSQTSRQLLWFSRLSLPLPQICLPPATQIQEVAYEMLMKVWRVQGWTISNTPNVSKDCTLAYILLTGFFSPTFEARTTTSWWSRILLAYAYISTCHVSLLAAPVRSDLLFGLDIQSRYTYPDNFLWLLVH